MKLEGQRDQGVMVVVKEGEEKVEEGMEVDEEEEEKEVSYYRTSTCDLGPMKFRFANSHIFGV